MPKFCIQHRLDSEEWTMCPYLGGISMVLQQVSFVERSSLSLRVPNRRFHCILYVFVAQQTFIFSP